MNAIKRKAKAGVTLVELLVVILIVTILSVAMLPLLQPFVTEAQYAAEAIPAIGNIRTKIGVYVYDKGHLPYDPTKIESDLNPHDLVQTWTPSTEGTGTGLYAPGTYDYGEYKQREEAVTVVEIKKDETGKRAAHFGSMLDVDYQDLTGNRSKPLHYQYFTISTNTSSYVVACFGNGDGLKKGTGYAVCEINFPQANRKLIGTWKRYKSYNDNAGAIVFTSNKDPDSEDGSKVLDCYVPNYDEVKDITTDNEEVDSLVTNMKNAGWEFN